MGTRHAFAERIRRREKQGEWGTSAEEEAAEEARRENFRQAPLHNTRKKLRVLAQSYQNMVEQFLVLLAGHQDASLRFLSFRLDFDEHYKSVHRRVSGIKSKASRR